MMYLTMQLASIRQGVQITHFPPPQAGQEQKVNEHSAARLMVTLMGVTPRPKRSTLLAILHPIGPLMIHQGLQTRKVLVKVAVL